MRFTRKRLYISTFSSGILLLAFWAAGLALRNHIHAVDMANAQQRQNPDSEVPKPKPIDDINGGPKGQTHPANLEGNAVIYPLTALRFIDEAGNFRMAISPIEAAKILNCKVSAIAKRDAPHEIDPDAELFPAILGTLTDNGKAESREIRKKQIAQGMIPDGVYSEWNIKRFSFTLNRLKNPNPEEKMVLDAIVRAKGGKASEGSIRATGLKRSDFEHGGPALAPGMLPEEI